MSRKPTYEKLEKRVKELEEEAVKRKQAEEALRESEKSWRDSFNSMEDIILIVNKDYTINRINDIGLKLFGKTVEEVIGEKCYRVIHGLDGPGKFCPFRETLKTGKPAVRDRYEKAFDKHFNIKTSPIFNKNGEITGFVDLMRDTTERNRREQELRERDKELEIKTSNLEEANAALKVLLKRRDEDKIELEEKVLSNVKELIFPYVEKLKTSRIDERQMVLIGIIESNLDDIISPFLRHLASKYSNITPKEIQVAGLIKDGKTTKEIAELLISTTRAIEFHRNNLRNKFGLKNKKANLRSYLLSLE